MAVYCLVDSLRDVCKVGYSRDEASLEKRIRDLQTANPYKLDVYACFTGGSRGDEASLQRKLCHAATDGGSEWFSFNQSKFTIDEFFASKGVRLQRDESEERLSKQNKTCRFTGYRKSDFPVFDYLQDIGDESPTLSDSVSPSALLCTAIHHTGGQFISPRDLAKQLTFYDKRVSFDVASILAYQLTDWRISNDGLQDQAPVVVINATDVWVLLEGDLDTWYPIACEIHNEGFWFVDGYYYFLRVAVLSFDGRVVEVPADGAYV